MINPGARLVSQPCVRCDERAKILIIPLCDACLNDAATELPIEGRTWETFSAWMKVKIKRHPTGSGQ